MSAQEALVAQSLQLAMVGKVAGVPYTVDTTNFEDVQRKWGKPAQQNAAGAGIYATYTQPAVAFGFNKGAQIFDIRSYDKTLQEITLSQVKRVLGTPGAVRAHGNETILLYTAGPKFQLLWIFPNATQANPDPHVDHISVFCPQDTVDLMAQNQPSPTVVIDETPGAVGSLFTFSIKNVPVGYSLAEFEWLGQDGRFVVNTLDEAVRNGQTGGVVPNFGVSGDGQTLSFVYPSNMAGRSGQVVLIYQNVNGSALMGQSDQIVLK